MFVAIESFATEQIFEASFRSHFDSSVETLLCRVDDEQDAGAGFILMHGGFERSGRDGEWACEIEISLEMLHDDVCARAEKATILAWATLDCNKPDRAVPLAVDALVQALERPMQGAERDVFLCTLEMVCAAATSAADMGTAYPYEALRKGARVLLSEGVQPHINRVRCFEACFGLGADGEAQGLADEVVERAAALAFHDAAVYRGYSPDPTLALLVARARALPARVERGIDVASTQETLRAALMAARAEYGGTHRADYMLNRVARRIEAV